MVEDKVNSRIGVKKHSSKYLPELVEVGLMNFCGFNYYETSFPLPSQYGIGSIHVSEPYQYTGRKNIVLIDQRTKEDNYETVKWYFGTFEGKAMIDRETPEEGDTYFQEVWKIFSPEHEICFREVRNRLIQTLDKESQHLFEKKR